MSSIKPLHLIFVFQRTRAKTIRVKTMDIVSKLVDQRNELFVVTVTVPPTSDVAVTRVSKNTRIEWFSLECRKLIALALTTQHDWFKNSRYFFIQSRVKPNPIATRSHTFSRALRRLHVMTWSSDWFTVLSASFVIGRSDYFGFGFTTL